MGEGAVTSAAFAAPARRRIVTQQDYSAEMPAFLMIGVQRSISDLRWARNASGRARSDDRVSAPAAASRSFTSGLFSASCSAPDSASITGLGVPLGAHI